MPGNASNDVIREAEGCLEEMDTSYADHWSEEAAGWDKRQTYQAASELLGTVPAGGIHMDIGAGLGHFLADLIQRYPEGRYLGVDSNMQMLRAAYAEMTRRKILSVFSAEAVHVFGNGAVRRSFGSGHDGFKSLLRQRGTAYLLGDDIRDASVTRRVLNGERLASASFLFPGTSKSALFEKPLTPDLRQEAVVLRACPESFLITVSVIVQ